MKKLIKELILGVPRRGERIIKQAPTVTTVQAHRTPSFNEWAQQFKVSSRYINFKK